MNTPQPYTRTAVGLHWIIALLIFAAFGLGWLMTDIPGFTMTKLKYYSWHKWLGITVFLLAVIRLLWRFFHVPPAWAGQIPLWQQWAAHAVHWALYALIFAIPLSGYFYSLAAGVPVVYLGLVPMPVLLEPNIALANPLKQLHVVLNYSLVALLLAHVGAALKHQWIDRDGTLARMLPFLNK
ncbi:MAG: cytochrome b [Moraxellaceae bacterium]|nr:MAG: cytochrome b [Moraxellaceae bacterium]